MTKMAQKSVLFVCLGNICRSPIAEAVFTDLVKKKGVADQVRKPDFSKYDFILGMDEENMSDLHDLAPADSKAKLALLGSYDPKGQKIIEDPYYGGDDGFEEVFQQCVRCCTAFLEQNS